jgi:hypothetical protein
MFLRHDNTFFLMEVNMRIPALFPESSRELIGNSLKRAKKIRVSEDPVYMVAHYAGFRCRADCRGHWLAHGYGMVGHVQSYYLLPAILRPELNPAEHVWDEIREKWFPNFVFHHMDGVEDTLMEALIALENDPDRVQSLTGFDWIINAY